MGKLLLAVIAVLIALGIILDIYQHREVITMQHAVVLEIDKLRESNEAHH